MATYNFLDKTGLGLVWDKIKALIPTKTSDLTNDSGYIIRNVYFGTCATEAATAAKEITLDNATGFSLVAGTAICVKFTYTNSASNVTFNVNNTGAKGIWYNNAAYTSNSSSIVGYAKRSFFYVYDGTYWVFLTQSTTYSNTYDRTYLSNSGYKAKSAIVAANLIVAGSDGLYFHLKSGDPFDIRFPILYASSAANAGAVNNGGYIIMYLTVTTTQAMTLTVGENIYVKGTLSGTTFTPISTTPLTQTLPSTDDGYYYLKVGKANTSTTMYLLPEHPIFVYKNGAIHEYGAVNADWSETDSTDPTYILNKPTIPTVTLNGSSSTTPSFYAPTSAGTSGQVLKSSGSGAPTWQAESKDVFLITVTATWDSSTSTYTFSKDKTDAEIANAYLNGNTLILRDNISYPISGSGNSEFSLRDINAAENYLGSAIFISQDQSCAYHFEYDYSSSATINYIPMAFNLFSTSGSTVTDGSHTWQQLWNAYLFCGSINIIDLGGRCAIPASIYFDWENHIGGDIAFLDQQGLIHHLSGFSSTNDGSDNITMSQEIINPKTVLCVTFSDGQTTGTYTCDKEFWEITTAKYYNTAVIGRYGNYDFYLGEKTNTVAKFYQIPVLGSGAITGYCFTVTAVNQGSSSEYTTVERSYINLSTPSITLNGSTSSSPSFYAPTSAGTSGYVLKSNGSGAPTWAAETDEVMVITITETGSGENVTYSADKTFAEIYAHLSAGNTAVCKLYSSVCQLASYDATSSTFKDTTIYDNFISGTAIEITSYDEIYVWRFSNTIPSASSTAPSADGTASAGSSTNYARADHVHPQSGVTSFNGSTGAITYTAPVTGVTLNGSSSSAPSFYAPTSAGASGYVLKSNGSGAPTWAAESKGVEVVTITETTVNDETTYTADKTYSELKSAWLAGKVVLLQKSGGSFMWYLCKAPSSAEGTSMLYFGALHGAGNVWYSINSSNVVTSHSLPQVYKVNNVAPNANGNISLTASDVGALSSATLSISSNVITLTGSDGTTSSVTLPVYNGGVVTPS